MIVRDLRKALDHTADVVASIPADRYRDPTPCPDMDVRSLVNHVVAGNVMFAGVAAGDPVDLSVFEKNQLGDDAPAAYRRSAELALAGWQRPGVLDEQLSFASMPGSAVIRMHLTEELVHGWDLAVATGQDATLDPQLAEISLEAVHPVPAEMLRTPQGFGPEVEIDAGAPVGDRLVAFLGRNPGAPIR